MNRSITNAILSVQAAVNATLPELVEVVRRPDGEMVRPFAVVAAIAADGTDAVDPWYPVVDLPLNVAVYLGDAESAVGAIDAGNAVRERLWGAFVGGEGPATAPRRIPFFDFEPRLGRHRAGGRMDRLAADEWPDAFRVVFPPAAGGGTRVLELPVPFEPGDVAAASAELAALFGGEAEVIRRHALAVELRYDGPAPTAVEMPGAVETELQTVLEPAAAPWRGPADNLRVEAWSAQVIPDPDEPKKAMVMGDLRCTFRRGTAVPSSRTYARRIGRRIDSTN